MANINNPPSGARSPARIPFRAAPFTMKQKFSIQKISKVKLLFSFCRSDAVPLDLNVLELKTFELLKILMQFNLCSARRESLKLEDFVINQESRA
jgi:hypothetical protein